MTIVSRGAIESMGLSEYGLKAVGTGPFKVTDHQLGQSMTLERNEAYWDPNRPGVDKVVITPIIDPEPFAAAMEAGDIQIVAFRYGWFWMIPFKVASASWGPLARLFSLCRVNSKTS